MTASRWSFGTSTRATRVTSVDTPSPGPSSQRGARCTAGSPHRVRVGGRGVLGEHVDRLGALCAAHPLGQRCRELVVGHLVERGHDGRADAGVQVGRRRRVERVDAQLEGGP